MRLAKYLALAGVASRRKAEELVREGRVQVNGVTALLPQTAVTAGDKVTLDGAPIYRVADKIYLLMDKPPGYLSSVTDTHGRPTVMDLVKDIPARAYPVGRLDADTSGVLLLTNDGELAYRLTHPRYQVKKVYRARVKGSPTPASLGRLARGGLELEGRKTAPAGVRMLSAGTGGSSFLEITLTEGRKRQVKVMCAAIGHPVIKLRRVRFAFLTARGLRPGEYRSLTNAEVERLYRLVQLSSPKS